MGDDTTPPAANGKTSRRREEDSETPQPPAKASRRRISHISKACNGCRRRKMKCDGAQPSCSICKVYKEECVYNPEQDGRRSAPKAYVASLEEKIRVLEGVLQAHGIDDKTPLPQQPRASSKEKDVPPPVDTGERLKIDESTGELLECGPTSLFSHKPDVDGKSPAASLSPGSLQGSGVDRPALLHPRPSICPELGSPELDPMLHDEVLRLFFEYFNTQCFWANEKGFKRDLAAATVVEGTIIRARRTAYYSPMLHNVIISIGVLMLPVDKALREQLALAFSKRAKNLIEEESESPMMSTVSALMLLGTYHAATSRQNLGFLYSGMGLRLVQALGLGTNCSYWVKNGSITEEQQMGRYHLFYAAYVLDKCWSTYVGRGASMTLSNYDIPVPDPDPEEDDVLWQPMIHNSGANGDASGSFSQDTTTPEPIKGWRSTTWAWTCRLAIIAERVLGTVYSIGFNTASTNVRHIVSDLDVKLEKWLEEIPDALRMPNVARGETRIVPSHILGLHAFHCFILILLHRPWFAQLHPGGSQDATAEISVSKCERAAHKVVQIANLYRKCPGLRYSPITLNQIVFSAGTVHLLCATHNSGRKAKASVDAVVSCISALEEMGDTLDCAARSAKTLQGLLDESNHAPPPKPAAPAPSVDIEKLIKDPQIADQLRKLGWAPPVPAPTPPAAASSASSSSMHHITSPTTAMTPLLVTTQGPRGQGIDFDWFTTPLSYHHPLSPSTSTHASLAAHGQQQQQQQQSSTQTHTPGHATPGAQGQQTQTHTPPDATQQQQQGLANLLQLNGTNSIYDVLYAGSANPSFPSGNVWSWPFGFTGERHL